MFDYVRCRYPLPSTGTQDLVYQTKSMPPPTLTRYDISPSGVLTREVRETDAAPSRETFEYRGELEIHTVLELPDQPRRWISYLLWFRDGRVVDVQHGSGHLDVLPDSPTVVKA
jgi:hypothetical protein